MKYLKLFEGFTEELKDALDEVNYKQQLALDQYKDKRNEIASKYLEELKNDVCIPLTDNYSCLFDTFVDQNTKHYKLPKEPHICVAVKIKDDFDIDFLEKNLNEFDLNLKASSLSDMEPYYYYNIVSLGYSTSNSSTKEKFLEVLRKWKHEIKEISFTIYLTK